jgi:hypothetical protein
VATLSCLAASLNVRGGRAGVKTRRGCQKIEHLPGGRESTRQEIEQLPGGSAQSHWQPTGISHLSKVATKNQLFETEALKGQSEP